MRDDFCVQCLHEHTVIYITDFKAVEAVSTAHPVLTSICQSEGSEA